MNTLPGNKTKLVCTIGPASDSPGMIEKMIEAAKKLVVGDAMDPNVYMGPVISAAAKKKIENYIDIGIEGGSKLVLDGRNPNIPEKNKNGYFVGPTIFTDVTPCRRIAQEEIFGPVVSVMKISGIDDALELIQAQEFGNGACIFTQNLYYTEKFIAEADVGMVGVNVGIPVPMSVFPFSGHKNSFFGDLHTMGRDGVAFFTETKAVTSYWYNEADLRGEKVGTWEGTITRK